MDAMRDLTEKVKSKSISRCVVAGCDTKRDNKVSNVILFSFPKDSNQNKIWCDNLGVADWIRAKYDKLRVCSLHFPSHFLIWAGQRYILNSKTAAPNKITGNLDQETYQFNLENATEPSTSQQQCNGTFIQEQKMQEHDSRFSELASDFYIPKSYDDNRPSTSIGFIHDVQVAVDPERPATSLGFCSSNLYTASSAEVIPVTKYMKLEKRIKEKDNIIHNLRRQLKRKEDKITTINDILEKLKNVRLVNEECATIIKHSAKGVPIELFKRYASNESLDKITKTKYSEEIKTFAHTLHFYSPKAYNYVRDVFRCALPHPDTVRHWYSKIDGTPGFTQQAFEAIKMKADLYKNDGKELCVTVMMDEMAIMRKTELVGGRLLGQVDLGIEYSNDCEDEAVEALVIMAVGMTEHWKIPIAYFLINGITSNMKTEIINMTIERLTDAGAKIVSITCDGLKSNEKMLENLGAVLDVNNPKPWFHFKGNLN